MRFWEKGFFLFFPPSLLLFGVELMCVWVDYGHNHANLFLNHGRKSANGVDVDSFLFLFLALSLILGSSLSTPLLSLFLLVLLHKRLDTYRLGNLYTRRKVMNAFLFLFLFLPPFSSLLVIFLTY